MDDTIAGVTDSKLTILVPSIDEEEQQEEQQEEMEFAEIKRKLSLLENQLEDGEESKKKLEEDYKEVHLEVFNT